jgi:hypothetical protein
LNVVARMSEAKSGVAATFFPGFRFAVAAGSFDLGMVLLAQYGSEDFAKRDGNGLSV